MISRFNRCVGITLFRLGRWQAELWILPSNEVVPQHTHEACDSRIFMVFGKVKFQIGERIKDLSFRHIGRSKAIPAGTPHAVSTSSWPGIFINVEHWNGAPTSAAVDFHKV